MNAKEALNQPYVYLGQLSRKLPKFQHGMYMVIRMKEYQAGSVVGYAIECGEDPYKAVLRSEQNGHTASRLWINACAVVISGHAAVAKRNADRYNSLPRYDIGDVVMFEGNVVRLVKAPNDNIGLEYLSNDEIAALEAKLRD